MLLLEAAQRWDLSERATKKALDENRVRHDFNEDGEPVIPDDEIRPLRLSAIQSFLWVVLRFKNDSSWIPDTSAVTVIQTSQLASVFKQLVYRKYLDQITGNEPIEQCFKQCRVTELGLQLVNADHLPGGWIRKSLVDSALGSIWTFLLEKIPILIGIA